MRVDLFCIQSLMGSIHLLPNYLMSKWLFDVSHDCFHGLIYFLIQHTHFSLTGFRYSLVLLCSSKSILRIEIKYLKQD